MKLPRWLVALLSVASLSLLLAATASWWITWPARTAQDYIDWMLAGEFDEANAMMTSNSGAQATVGMPSWVIKLQFQSKLKRNPPTIYDLLVCQRRFELDGINGQLTARRGKMTFALGSKKDTILEFKPTDTTEQPSKS